MSRSRWLALAAVVLAAGLGACSVVGVGPSQPQTISVTGSASTTLDPDVVIVTLGVQTTGPDVAEAVADNNRRAAEVTGVFRAAGLDAADIQTTYFNVYPQQLYDQVGNPTGETSYWVDNTITVKIRQLDQVGTLLQTALTRGANSVQGVYYSVEDPSEALDEIRADALDDAGAQAEALASQAGVDLGEVITVSESAPVASPLFEAPAYGKGGGGAGVPTQPGSLEYQVQLYVIYRIR